MVLRYIFTFIFYIFDNFVLNKFLLILTQSLTFFLKKVITNNNSVLERLSLLHQMLLWFWDIERTRKPYTIQLVLVTKNLDYIPFIREFQNRG